MSGAASLPGVPVKDCINGGVQSVNLDSTVHAEL